MPAGAVPAPFAGVGELRRRGRPARPGRRRDQPRRVHRRGRRAGRLRRAAALTGERSIIALRATSRRRSRRSRPQLDGGVVTTARSDVDAVVTEYGVAHLRGCSVAERARRLVAIAAPEFRDQLDQERTRACEPLPQPRRASAKSVRATDSRTNPKPSPPPTRSD